MLEDIDEIHIEAEQDFKGIDFWLNNDTEKGRQFRLLLYHTLVVNAPERKYVIKNVKRAETHINKNKYRKIIIYLVQVLKNIWKNFCGFFLRLGT